MCRIIIIAAALALSTAAKADDESYRAAYPTRDSGIGSYSNVYGNGWTKVCCDYPYFRPYPRFRRPHNTRRPNHD